MSDVESWTNADGELTAPAVARINGHLNPLYKDRVCPCGQTGPYNVDPSAAGLSRRFRNLEVVVVVTCRSCGRVDLYSLGVLNSLLGTPSR